MDSIAKESWVVKYMSLGILFSKSLVLTQAFYFDPSMFISEDVFLQMLEPNEDD